MSGLVPLARQRLYSLLHPGMIALRGEELLVLQVCNLPLQFDDLLWMVAHHMYFPDRLRVRCHPYQHLLCLCKCLGQLIESDGVLLYVDVRHDGALVLRKHPGRSGFR